MSGAQAISDRKADRRMNLTVGIIQPNYLPWRGYFDFIAEVDLFIFLDDVQYTRRDWRNRNRIRLLKGDSEWITVPVLHGGLCEIREARIDQTRPWSEQHLASFQRNYSGTEGFAALFPILAENLSRPWERIADLDITMTKVILKHLGITTPLMCASDFGIEGRRDERLIRLVRAVDGTRYLSGPAALDYLQPELWSAAGIELAFKSYVGYAPYEQVGPGFDPQISIVDTIFMTGAAAPLYVRPLREIEDQLTRRAGEPR